MDRAINLPDSTSNSSLKLCQQQSWFTSGPRLLQHLLFLLTVLDEPSAASATLFGFGFLLLFFCGVGARNSSAILHCSRQFNRWPRYSCYQLMWMLAGEDQGKLLPSQTEHQALFQNSQSSAVFMLRHAKQQSPPYHTEVSCISSTQKETKHPSFTFATIPWSSPYGERMKAPLGCWELPRILASVRLFPSLKGRIYFN